ncbi:btk-binding protein-related [Anaeramoeba flamelloides]|uniref:Btk-binding protein-related n=1 Tax=Anaeramoeba flamelloides TaxID=1746091 RepID=A0AAV7YG78_9EUKA|nr:btk-binding protein-related [Anaeramoeba flamelloides]
MFFPHYYLGDKMFKFLSPEYQTLPMVTPLTSCPDILTGIAISQVGHILVHINTKEFALINQNGYHKKKLPEDEEIEKITSGNFTYLIRTKSGNIYSMGINNTHHQLPFPSSVIKNCSFTPKLVSFFSEKKIKIKSVIQQTQGNYFLTTTGLLYRNGAYTNNLGHVSKCGRPFLVYKDINRIFGGAFSKGFFFTITKNYSDYSKTNDLLKLDGNGELFGCGWNDLGQLGYKALLKEDYFKDSKTRRINNFFDDQIQDIVSHEDHTLLLSYEGKIYSTGSKEVNGLGFQSYAFKLIPKLKNKVIIQISGGYRHSLVLTSTYQIYAWGFKPPYRPINDQNIDWSIPTQIIVPNLHSNLGNQIGISSSYFSSFIFQIYSHPLLQDFKQLYQSQDNCNVTLPHEIKSHQLLLELRTGSKIEKILQVLEKFSKNEILAFLNWVYSDHVSSEFSEIIKTLFEHFKLEFPPKNTLEADLLNLYNNNKSKKFTIICRQDDEDSDDQENENDKKNKYFKIPVHKLILIARSELFQGLFLYQPDLEQIQDYSGKSVETLQYLIKYLYTETLDIPVDHENIHTIIDELDDSVEYYQLNRFSKLPVLIANLKKKMAENEKKNDKFKEKENDIEKEIQVEKEEKKK